MENHLSKEQLEAGTEQILTAPKENGKLEMIVRRPDVDEREVLTTGRLTFSDGLEGDNWKVKGSSKTEDGSSHPDMQLNIMNSRCVHLLAGSRDRWPLAGDQLYVNLDLSEENLPPGSQLSIGDSIVEITSIPHNGCKKFAERFGKEAVRYVNSKIGKANHFRGLNAKVVKEGEIREGDMVRKVK